MRTQRSQRGVIFPLTALFLPILVLAVAFAVDLGRLRVERRDRQADADVIALDLVRLADGRSEADIFVSVDYATVLARSAAANDVDPASLTVDYGMYDAATDSFDGSANATPTAVQVTSPGEVPFFFARVIGSNDGDTVRTAIASQDAIAGFQIGSRLASIDPAQASILGRVFQRALGGSPAFTAVGYNGLLNTQIPLGPLAAQAGFGSPDELLNASAVNAQGFFLAAAQVMQNQGNTAAASALNAIATETDSTLTLDGGQLGRIEQGGSAAAANASVDLFSLITGSVFAINGTNTISIPSLDIGVPGAMTSLSLSVIERPRFVFGRRGASVSTAQATLATTTTLTNFPIGLPPLAGATVSGTVPFTIGLAGSTGRLDQIDCDSTPSIAVGVTPMPISVTSSLNLDVRATVLLANVLIAQANVPVGSPVVVSGMSSGASFLFPNEFLPTVGTGTLKPSPTGSLSLTGPTVGNANVTVLGAVSLPVGSIAAALNASVVSPISIGVTTLLTMRLNRLLGLDIGGSDVGALDLQCDAVKLVS